MKNALLYLTETGYERPSFVEELFSEQEKKRATTILKQLEGLEIVDALDFIERCKQAIMQSEFNLHPSLHKDMCSNQKENKVKEVKVAEKTFDELADEYITPITNCLEMEIKYSNNKIDDLTKRVEKIECAFKQVYKIFILFATIYVLTFVFIALLQLFC